MTDDSTLTPGGDMNGLSSVNVDIRSDAEGHWVEWTKNGEVGRLGPYADADTAENVRAAKTAELNENDMHIDDAIATPPRYVDVP